MKTLGVARALAILVAASSLILAGLFAGPVAAVDDEPPPSPEPSLVVSDDRGLGTPPPTDASSEPSNVTDPLTAAAGDAWINRLHTTSNNERVDLPSNVITKVREVHKVNFTVLVHVIEWARSPRMTTSYSSGAIDRGVYRYRLYEYVNGRRSGRWVIIEFVIEWGDGVNNRGFAVTAYPVSTNTGPPPKNRATGKTYCPDWAARLPAVGPPNNDILY